MSTRLHPHLFLPGPADEADHLGRTICQACNVVGRPGDAHHTLPPAPEVDVQQLRAGENGGD